METGERVRTLAARAVPSHVTSGGIAGPARGGVGADGRPILLAREGEISGSVVTVDLVAYRFIRGERHTLGLLKMQGWAQAVPPEEKRDAAVAIAATCPDEALFEVVEGVSEAPRLVRLDPASVVYLAGGDSGRLDAEDYLAASPDPLLPYAERLLDHINEDHRRQLAACVDGMPGCDGRDVWLWELDRHGATVRAAGRGDGRPRMIRFAWPEPAGTGLALQQALYRLLLRPASRAH